jgi:chromosome segregation ATPase
LTQEKNTLNNHVKQLEGEIQSLNDKIRDFDKVSDNSGYIETLQVQIAQKDHDIHKLEFENNQNIQTIQQLKINLAEKESQLTTTAQDNNDLDIYNRTQQLEQKIRSLTEKLRDVEWELSVSKFQVSNNSSLIEELRKQISQKNASIKKLEYENSENIESLKWLADNLNEKEAQIKLITREKLELDSCVKELEREKTILSQKLIDAELEVKKLKQRSNHSSSVDELQKQIAEKDTYIQNLELEKEDLEQYLEYIEIFGSEDLENYEYIYKLLLCRKVGTVHRIFTTVSIKILRSII